MLVQGKNAIVTGGSQGIGRAIALKLAENGANVAILYVGDRQRGAETVKEIEALGVKAMEVYCNVADFEESKAAVDEVVKTLGSVDILINNAGITRDNLILKMTEAEFDSVINVNLKGTFNMIKHTYPLFMRQRYGRVVSISSVVGIGGNKGQANYSASKAGIIGMTKSAAKELASRGVTYNAIAPGFIETDMTAVLPEEAKKAMCDQIPAKRTGKPEDVANLALFLASDMAAYITGEVVRCDGGMQM
ncbi:MAG: 3-oxoacyl-[acyl-carrier-protein] reductase [Oscillospiraceae bacterium]|nr:3-oxoacyl-[acyl-carrier-protein] reductase [Oscillospiraceae bacterium]